MTFPNIKHEVLQVVFDRYQINTPLRKAWFMANCHHESGGFTRFEENLNYKVNDLIKLFSRKRISLDQCNKFGRTATQKADKQSIANAIYGGEWGKINLGNTQPNDGYFFRGSGAIQLTGRRNQVAYFKARGLEINPEILRSLDYALDSAGWFWQTNKLNSLADTNKAQDICKRVNGGLIGFEERKELFNFYYNYFK